MAAILIAFVTSYLVQGDSQSPEALRKLAQGEMVGMEIFDEPKISPTTAFHDADGRDIRLGDLKGQVTLVNFWATWCAPCIKEMPSLSRLQATLGSEDFQIAVVSIDREGFEVTEPFLANLGVQNLTSYLDRSTRLTIEVGAIGLPTTILLNRNGEIVGRTIGPANWDSKDAKRLISALMK